MRSNWLLIQNLKRYSSFHIFIYFVEEKDLLGKMPNILKRNNRGKSPPYLLTNLDSSKLKERNQKKSKGLVPSSVSFLKIS